MPDDISALAQAILDQVGGGENILEATHCMTRLRFTLASDERVNQDALTKLPGILAVIVQDSHVQIVIGPSVDKVFDAIKDRIGTQDQQACKLPTQPSEYLADATLEPSARDNQRPVRRPLANRLACLVRAFLDLLAGSLVPVIGILGATGIAKGFLALLSYTGTSSPAFLYLLIDIPYRHLPALIAVSAARKLGGSPWAPVAIALSLVAVSEDAAGESTGLANLPTFNYAGTLFPALAATYICCRAEPFIKRVLPSCAQEPITSLALSAAVGSMTLLCIAPIVYVLDNALYGLILATFGLAPAAWALLIGACWQPIVSHGFHWLFTPLLIEHIAMDGNDPVLLATIIPQLAQAGIALGAAAASISRRERRNALAAASQALFGVTEPALYGYTLKSDFLSISSYVAGGCGAAVSAALGGTFYGVTGGILGLFGAASTSDQGRSILAYAAGAAVALTASAALGAVQRMWQTR